VNDPVRPAAQGTANAVGALLRGSAVPALFAVAGLALAGALVSPAAGASVLLGGGMAMFALAVGPALHQLCRNLDPSLLIGVAILAYCTAIGLVGIGYFQVSDASWLVGGFAGAGVAIATLTWTAGHLWAALKLRQPLYDESEPTAGR
jgi:hypothetical protein